MLAKSVRDMRKVYLAALALGLTLYGCKKEEEEQEDYGVTTVVEHSMAESSFSDVSTVVNSIGIDEEGVEKTSDSSGCALVTVSTAPGQFPKVVTIDYGQSCTDFDGRVKSGQMILTYSNSWLSDTCYANVEMINYHIDGVKYEGSIALQRVSSPNKVEVTTNVSNGKVHTESGVVTYETVKTTEWVAGVGTLTKDDDIIKIYGSSNGVGSDGLNYASVVIQPMYKELSCGYISGGIVDVAPEGKLTRSTNYGDRTCDDKATVTIGDRSFEITLN